MKQRLRSAAVLFAAATASVGIATPAHAADPVTVVARGLDQPYGLTSWNGNLFTAESSSGQITGGPPGRAEVPRLAGLPHPSGVDRKRENFYVVTAEAGPGQSTYATSSLIITQRGKPRQRVDLRAYELANNPDGQRQFGDDGAPLDALSNPFAVLTGRGFDNRVFVADGGANAVLVVDQNLKVSTFFVPPTVNTGACAGAENNDPEHTGCDSVPTGLAWGPDGNLYVSAFTAGAPGEGRVYVLDPFDGGLLGTLGGFTGPTGVAVGPDGSVYVSELTEGAPPLEGPPGEEAPPPPDFDPSTVGQIVKVERSGRRTAAQVTMPVGMTFLDGTLYSTAWSAAGDFLGLPGRGEIVRVDASAFVPLP
ncbi:ScyD/ScyE family protein [Kineococcus aurantiacus]|uniref:ScyD/ScyE family protein n=1 Tax=Kineococcus aurantiacus TaxID=37633 RepID=A0A7Y9J1D3_9ACTN|nr:ScyD/ScyE family protein [Kineococcus aurantiacus]NYD23032.1 hypothetical protein [Kineococcus aurantiacus]